METSTPCRTNFDFTQDWLTPHLPGWKAIFAEHVRDHDKFLEVGSFEGRSACWLLQNALSSGGQLYCIDSWTGSPELMSLPEGSVQESHRRFRLNTAIAKGPDQQVIEMQMESVAALASLIHEGHRDTFNFIYIDGGHQASDCLTDAVMSWPLLKQGGVMIIDDVLWGQGGALEHRPKIAVDAFTSIFSRDLHIVGYGYQVGVKKL